MRATSTNLIQSYQTPTFVINPNNPTSVNVRFQYSPTFPLNYVQVTMSVNTQTGSITNVSNIGAAAV